MNVLAIESSGPVGSVAAWRDGRAVAEGELERGMEHGRMLVALADRVIRSAGWDKRRDIELVAVSQGPGSYTGLRVGIAFAKTLAALTGAPLVGVCSLDAMAENAPPEQGHVLTVLDGRRGDLYVCAYETRHGRRCRVHGPALMKPDRACELLPGPVYVMGDALVRYASEFAPPKFIPSPEQLWRIKAAVVAGLAEELFRQGRRDNAVSLQPIYLRLAEAEEKRLARERREA